MKTSGLAAPAGGREGLCVLHSAVPREPSSPDLASGAQETAPARTSFFFACTGSSLLHAGSLQLHWAGLLFVGVQGPPTAAPPTPGNTEVFQMETKRHWAVTQIHMNKKSFKGNYIGKYKRYYKCVFKNSTSFFFYPDLKDNCIKQQL